MKMINLFNIKKSKIYSYSLVLLKGSLHSSINSNLINVCVNNTTNCWPVCHNRFKLLIHLQHDINKVRIWIESNNKTVLAEVNLTLYYKPLLNKKYIKIVYLLCEDEFGDLFDFGRFQAPLDEDNSISSAMKRLSLNMLIIQCFIAQTLPVHKTFNLELDQNNFPSVNLFKIKLANKQIRCLEPNQLWEYVAQQLMCSQLANQDYKYIAFCSFTRYSSDTHECTSNLCDINTNGLAHISLGGGGLALLGSACLHMWPENINQIVDRFNNQSLIDNNVISQNDCAKRFIWGCYSTTLGACIHEIGHILDLGHSSTHGIMATDFNNIHTFFTIKSFNSTEIKWWLSSEINILSHHKWINDAVIEDSANDVLYKSNNIIKSKYGIVVIEYRDPINNTIIFNELFTLPAKIVKIKQINKQCEMFAIDIYGNIIKLLLN